MVAGKILVVDQDKPFREAAMQLLATQGYACDSASEPAEANRMLQTQAYDLLIADMQLPGNSNLEWVRSLAGKAKIPVILVTQEPSLESAIEAVHLPAAAYLVKPVQDSELLSHIERSLRQSPLLRALEHLERHLGVLQQDARNMMNPSASSQRSSADAFLSLILQTIAGCLMDLKQVWQMGQIRDPLHCPRCQSLLKAVREAVVVLEQTRRAFQSKDLAVLRKSLTKLLLELDQAQN